MSGCGTWVRGVDVTVDQTVKGHRCTPGEDHAEEDSQEMLPTELRFPPREHGGQERERERKQGMAEADEAEKVSEIGHLAGVC